MRNLMSLLLFLVMCMPCSGSVAKQSVNLSDLNDIRMFEKLMHADSHGKPGPEQMYLRSLRDELSQTAVAERLSVLRKLSEETKWGTYRRFIAYYVCAWYGVNYQKTVDYLIHAAFWWEWKIGSEAQRPFNFADVSIDLLYALYEHNHDFRILHDILTTQGDAGTGELIVGFTEDAAAKHPRGVLHIAGMSAKGRRLVCRLLHLPPRDENHPLYILYGAEGSLRTLRTYITRVANDPKDPLNRLARDLLKKPARRCM